MGSSAHQVRILITGGDGFVGRYLVQALTGALPGGAEIIVGVLDDTEPTSGASRRVVLDVTNADEVRSTIATIRPTHLFHLAAIAAVPGAQRDLRRTWSVNFGGSLNVAIAVSEVAPQCRMIHCSSAEIYGASFRPGVALDETAALDPVNAYGASKGAADLMIGQMAKQGLRAIRLRPFNHIGPGQNEQFVVPAFAAQIARIERGEQEPVVRVGSLSARRDFLDVRDVVDAYLQVVLRFDTLAPGSALNIASGQAISIGEILRTLLALSTKDIRVEEDQSRIRTVDTPTVLGNAGRARRELGWAPKRPITETLSAVLDYFRASVTS